MEKNKKEQADKEAQKPEDMVPQDEMASEGTDNSADQVDVTSDDQQNVEGNLFEVVVARQEAEKNLQGWQRERAEFTNYKRRVERDLKDSRQRAAHDIIKAFIPVVDDFERALANIPEDIAQNPWVTGTNLIYRKFTQIIDDHGVQVLDPVGEEFDPRYHEAVGVDESDTIKSGHVTVTLQKGYLLGERVIRPALVRVAN